MNVRIERITAQPIAVVRRRARFSELANVIPEACGLVWNALKAAGIKGGRHVAVYRGSVEEMELEVGAEIDHPFASTAEVVLSQLPAGEVATATHLGHYHTLGMTHQAIHEWCARERRQLAGVRWEIYGHWETQWNDHPERIRTDVYYLLA